MHTLDACEAEARFDDLLERVARGEEIVITKHGKPIARLVPAAGIDREKVAKAIAEIEELAKGNRLDGLSVRELRDEGRP